jgi:hypothetical protein
MYEDDDGIVVIMCGIYITKYMWSDNLKMEDRRENQKILRGGRQGEPFTIRTSEPDGSEVLLSVERF